uniref:Alternative protein ST6GAL1 n=1 Tax=Homo sapiens TaxID=9606 RepID=L8E992_HUMAN|nr:alternative protein ST6GAL1 [Homo sapiens]
MSEVASAASRQIPGNPEPQNVIPPGSAWPDPVLSAGFTYQSHSSFSIPTPKSSPNHHLFFFFKAFFALKAS